MNNPPQTESGLDWFWKTFGSDTTNKQTTDPLNGRDGVCVSALAPYFLDQRLVIEPFSQRLDHRRCV